MLRVDYPYYVGTAHPNRYAHDLFYSWLYILLINFGYIIKLQRAHAMMQLHVSVRVGSVTLM